MDAVIYGNTPRATMLIRLRAPPLKRSRKPRSWLFRKRLSNSNWSIPGIGMWATNLYSANIPNVNRILARRSGRLKASMAAWIKLGHLPPDATDGIILVKVTL